LIKVANVHAAPTAPAPIIPIFMACLVEVLDCSEIAASRHLGST
jgi:hypothetical protein